MGQSTDAYLFYGYCWDEYTKDIEASDYDEDDYEEGVDPEPRPGLITDMDIWADKVLADRGHTDPWSSHPGGSSPEWMAANREALDAWRDLKESVKSDAGVEWDSHCSGECPMPFLCIPESKQVAYRGDCKPVMSLTAGEDWNTRLAAHMQAQGASVPEGENQPGWWLVSYWG